MREVEVAAVRVRPRRRDEVIKASIGCREQILVRRKFLQCEDGVAAGQHFRAKRQRFFVVRVRPFFTTGEVFQRLFPACAAMRFQRSIESSRYRLAACYYLMHSIYTPYLEIVSDNSALLVCDGAGVGCASSYIDRGPVDAAPAVVALAGCLISLSCGVGVRIVNRELVRPRAERGHIEVSVRVGLSSVADVAARIARDDRCTAHGRAPSVNDRSLDVAQARCRSEEEYRLRNQASRGV